MNKITKYFNQMLCSQNVSFSSIWVLVTMNLLSYEMICAVTNTFHTINIFRTFIQKRLIGLDQGLLQVTDVL